MEKKIITLLKNLFISRLIGCKQKCNHEYYQSSYTCIGLNYYPKFVGQTCRKCGDKRQVKNKYMSCCGREKKTEESCMFCGNE